MSLRRKIFGLLFVFAVIISCSNGKESFDHLKKLNADSVKIENVFVYRCGSEMKFSVHIVQEKAVLYLPDTTVAVKHVRSASGAKYQSDSYLFWSKGDEAILKIGDQLYKSCESIPQERAWQAAQLRGVDFRALGQEPGWYLEITKGKQIKYVGNYGEDTLITPVPAPQTFQSGKTVYQAETEAHAITVEITSESCTDAMSGFKFPLTVTVTADGTSYAGCGRMLN